MGNQFSKGAYVLEWWDHIVGVPEPEFCKLTNAERSHFFTTNKEGNLLLHRSPGHGKGVCCGQYRVQSIGELMGDVFVPQGPSKLVFTTRCDVEPESIRQVDVAHAQSRPENRGAMFHVASNHNGVEAISQSLSVEDKTFVTDYIYDKTQGPAASISAGGAAIARHYAAFQGAEGVWERQTKDRQVNFLEGLSDFCFMENGYCVLRSNAEEWEQAEKAKLKKQVSVGIHRNVQVTFGKRGAERFEGVENSANQLIHQCFGAAVNLGQGAGAIDNRKQPHAKDFARFVLECMYTGVFLAAHQQKVQKLYLTLLGGGVFGNSFRDILLAICDAFNGYGSNLEVHVTLFTPTKLEDVQPILEEGLEKDAKWSFRVAEKGVVKEVFNNEK